VRLGGGDPQHALRLLLVAEEHTKFRVCAQVGADEDVVHTTWRYVSTRPLGAEDSREAGK
jgi:hypothetical protein